MVSNIVHVHIAATQFFKISSVIIILFSSLSTIIKYNNVNNNAMIAADNDNDNDGDNDNDNDGDNDNDNDGDNDDDNDGDNDDDKGKTVIRIAHLSLEHILRSLVFTL